MFSLRARVILPLLLISISLVVSATPVYGAGMQTKEQQVIQELYPANTLATLSSDMTPLTKAEALDVLFEYSHITIDPKYTGEHTALREVPQDIAPMESLYPVVATLCDEHLLVCDPMKPFNKNAPITLPGFLKLFFLLQKTQDGRQAFLEQYSPGMKEWFDPYVKAAKSLGYIGEKRDLAAPFTHADLFYFLYKDTLLKQYENYLPYYFKGLVRSEDDIIFEEYPTLSSLDAVLGSYTHVLEYLSKKAIQTNNFIEKDKIIKIMARLQDYHRIFSKNRAEIALHPLWYDPQFSAETRTTFKSLGIKEMVGEGYYDFHTSAAYRKKNIWAALSKMEGVLLQPGEEFNYWGILKEKGMNDIGEGWIISAGKEVWAWGGGLCGSATALFRGAWNAGLEITDRRPHSIYYLGMYTRADLGLDAMVAQGASNLRFKNTTGAPLMIHVAYTDASRGAVKIQMLGTKHFSQIDLLPLARAGGQYIRTRILHLPDGGTKEDKIYSSYRKFM